MTSYTGTTIGTPRERRSLATAQHASGQVVGYSSLQVQKVLGETTERRTKTGTKNGFTDSSQIGGWENAVDKPGNRVPCFVSVSCVTCRACEIVRVKFASRCRRVFGIAVLLLLRPVAPLVSRRCPVHLCSPFHFSIFKGFKHQVTHLFPAPPFSGHPKTKRERRQHPPQREHGVRQHDLQVDRGKHSFFSVIEKYFDDLQ